MKNIKILFLVLGISCLLLVLYPFLFYKKMELYNESVVAIYLNDEVSNMPSSDSHVLFDEEESYCSNGTHMSWDYDNWKLKVSDLSLTKTKCVLHFRDYYKVKVDSETINVPIENASTTFMSKGNILKCNNGVQLKENEGTITIENISKDTICNYYDTSLDAINHLDDTENYILFLKNEEEENLLKILENKNVTIDLNGYTKYGYLQSYGNLSLVSSKKEKGTIQNTLNNHAIETYGNFNTILQNVSINSKGSAIVLFDQSKMKILNSAVYATSSSGIYSSEHSNLEILTSRIEGQYGIGGEGGEILIDTSEIIGNNNCGIQVNQGGSANILIKNASKVTGPIGILMYPKTTLTLDGDSLNYPIITATNQRALSLDNEEAIVYFNYGELFGKAPNQVIGKIIPRDGTTLKTETKDEIIHTYLE